MNSKLLLEEEKPAWFNYPDGFLRMINQNLVNFDPWIVLFDDRLRFRYDGLQERFPRRELVPFARRFDNDDIACWEKDRVGIVIIHDYASAGWEQGKEFDSLWDWLREALETTIEHGGEK